MFTVIIKSQGFQRPVNYQPITKGYTINSLKSSSTLSKI